MKKKYRASNGWAIYPDKDMKMLEDMSAKGWHVTGIKGIWYEFEQGEPHAYSYNMSMEKHPTNDMCAMFQSSGWTPVIIENGWQIFRAEAGATPIFTDNESRIELLLPKYKSYRKASIISIIGTILSFWLAYTYPVLPLTLISLCFVVFCVYSVLPFCGLWKMLRDYQQN